MSSIVIWRSGDGRVVAQWNKAAPYSVTEKLNERGSVTRSRNYRTEEAAIRAARRLSRKLARGASAKET